MNDMYFALKGSNCQATVSKATRLDNVHPDPVPSSGSTRICIKKTFNRPLMSVSL